MIDRRHPSMEFDTIPIHPEARAAAVAVAQRVIAGGQSVAVAAVLAGVAMIRKVGELAHRGACYPLASGERLAGVHPADVHVALKMLQLHGGDEGPRAEDAMARALAAVDASRQARAQKLAAAPCRRPLAVADVAADLAVARERARVHHVTVSGSRR